MYTELGDVSFFTQLGTDGVAGLNVEQKILHPTLALTLDEIIDAGWETDPNKQSEVETDPEHKELLLKICVILGRANPSTEKRLIRDSSGTPEHEALSALNMPDKIFIND